MSTMGYRLRFVVYVITTLGFAAIAAAGFGFWVYSVAHNDPAGQIFGIVFGGIAGVMWLASIFIRAQKRKVSLGHMPYRYL